MRDSVAARQALIICLSPCFALACTATAVAQVEVDPDQQYLLLATQRTSTMQEELDSAAALGFRVVTGSPTSGTEIALLLERVATPPDTFQYLLLATSRTSTMETELTEASRRGFRLLPQTMISKSQRFGGDEVVVVLERSPGRTEQDFEYQLLATNRTSTLQTEVTQLLDAGYTVAGLVSRGEHMVIMEREAR